MHQVVTNYLSRLVLQVSCIDLMKDHAERLFSGSFFLHGLDGLLGFLAPFSPSSSDSFLALFCLNNSLFESLCKAYHGQLCCSCIKGKRVCQKLIVRYQARILSNPNTILVSLSFARQPLIDRLHRHCAPIRLLPRPRDTKRR